MPLLTSSVPGLRSPRRVRALLVLAVGLVLPAAPVRAQSTEEPTLRRAIEAYDAGRLEEAMSRLAEVPPTLPARDQAVRYLYEGLIRLAGGDNERAHTSFMRAVALDPSIRLDPAVHAPSRVRAFEDARDQAVAQWRMFAAQAEERADTIEARRQWEAISEALPGDPEAEAALARIAPRLPPVTADPIAVDTAAPPVVAANVRRYSPGQALMLGMVVPGMGEVYSGRTVRGLVVLGAAAGAIATGLMVERVTVDCLIIPINGQCPLDQVADERVERPYLAAGIGAAAAFTLLGAIDAYFGARAHNARVDSSTGAHLERPMLRLGLADVRLELLRLRF